MPVPVDRRGDERTREDLLDAARHDPGTRAVVVDGDRLAADASGRLALVPLARLEGAEIPAFLGRGTDGEAVLLARARAGRGHPEPASWLSPRQARRGLPEADAALAFQALALSRFIDESGFCPVCGAACALVQAGWVRQCPACGRQHFPRTDPAIIVAITDASGERLLLGSNAAWPLGRFSCFAGFVEAGESAEEALRREVREEAGIELSRLRPIDSQPWPYPRSLMLGYAAVADGLVPARADGEEILEVRWFTRAEIGQALAADADEVPPGGLALPGPASIARSLIERWHAGELPA